MSLRSTIYLLPLLAILGCRGSDETAAVDATKASAASPASNEYREELLTYAIDNLNRLEEFGSNEVAHQIIQRLQSKNLPEDHLLASWPEPEMLRQVVDRLNQWIQSQSAPPGWSIDPMLATVPEKYRQLSEVKDLAAMRFSRFDGYALQEATWLRDIAASNKGELLDELQRAKNLFDWTVRNIQIEPNDPRRPPQLPWETLLHGRGTALERASVFVLLLRQLDIDAAVLAIELPAVAQTPAAAAPPSPQAVWCVGVLIDKEVYLFDPILGLPIPGSNGVALNDKGELIFQPATLKQVAGDDKLLRRLDANGTHPYPLKAAEIQHVIALLDASPNYLAQAMKVLESKLVGANKMVLASSPSKQAERWKAAAGIGKVELWLQPFETIERRRQLDDRQVRSQLAAMLPFYAIPSAPLYRGRILQLKGKLLGETGAMQYFQAARPSQEELFTSSISNEEKLMRSLGKQNASYWAGLITYQRGNYSAAIDYFLRRTFEAYPNGRWTTGALYNLARSYEASGQRERAILQYGSNSSSPGYAGDLLRAKWLEELASPKPPAK